MTVAFTPQYVSPETALEEVTSFACDIWALGIIVFEIVTGRKAWASRKPNSIIVGLSRQEDPFQDLARHAQEHPDFEREFELVRLCTQYDFTRRPKIEQLIAL
jgi:serine/threonine protein kinase